MDIVYNGVHLSMCTIEEYSEQVVYDPTGTDYLFTKHRIVGKAVANGQVEVREMAGPPVSYRKTSEVVTATQMEKDTVPDGVTVENGEVGSVNLGMFGRVFHDPTGFGVFGNLPPQGIYARSRGELLYYKLIPTANPVPLTVQAIRHRLSVPRAQLYVFAGTGLDGELLLRSPATVTDHCDANNGPKPISTELIYSKGEAGSHLFQFGIETYINESQDGVPGVGAVSSAFPRSESPVLSNRFSMRHVVNEDQVTVIMVEGEAYFRTDGVYGGSLGPPVSPDDLRVRLFLPCPFGFVREQIVAEGMPAANGVKYSFQDRQLPVYFPGGAVWNATRVSAVHTQAVITDTDLLTGTAGAFNQLTGQLLNAKYLRDSNATAVPQQTTQGAKSNGQQTPRSGRTNRPPLAPPTRLQTRIPNPR